MSADSPPSSTQWHTAAVMIVRDAAQGVVRALDSIRPWVDELVVLDTGSRDDTVARARAAGARVAQMDWPDDFSQARNTALELAGADWHVVLDADEWLQDGGPALAGLRQQDPGFVGTVEVDSQQGPGEAHASSWLSRVLPGTVRYTGRIHEQPVHAWPVRRLPVRFGHDGYRPEALRAKAGRNAALLQAMLQAQPADAYLWYQYGKDHDVYERWSDAVAAFDRAEALLGTARPAWLHDLVVRRLHALKRCARHAQALDLAQAELADWGHSPDFFFALGDLLLDWAAEEPRLAPELIPMMEQAWQQCLALGEHPELEGTVHGRGSHLAASNLALLYDTLGRADDAAQARRLAVPA
ncbi:glycosyltransferase [Ideonella sp. B508-1]|uniref:glycosyltransferase n=1 Tax=Ideonella sp. B508-1 TaxID=137716 RepID=UPI0003B4326F|nr:glycosyltransferase [Ideonella sp. B508-1]